MKKVVITAIVCALSAVSVIVIPDMLIKSYPTAKNISVQKVEHTDTYELNGSIVKNAKDGGMYVKAYATEKEISNIMLGQKAEITGDAFPDCIYTGEVSYIADFASVKQVGNLSKTVIEIRVDIISPDEHLKPGYTAVTSIILSEPEIMTILPYEIVNSDDNGDFVYVLEENKAKKRYIETGKELVNGIEVVAGITVNDYVIKPDETCSEGDTVLIVE